MEDLGIDNKPGAMDDGSGGGDLFPPPLNRPSHSGAAANDELFCMQKMEEMTRRFQASAYHLQYKDNKTDIARYSDKIRLAAAAGQRTVLECINALGPTKDAYFCQELLDGLMGKNSTVAKRGVGGAAGANSSKSTALGKSGRKEGAGAAALAGAGVSLLSKLEDDIGAGAGAGAGGDRRRKRANSHTAHTLERLSQRERASGGPKDAEAAKKARAGSIDSGAGGSVMEEEEEEVENDDDYIVDHYGSDDGGGDDDGGDDEPFY